MNTKIKCEGVTARDIAHPSSICGWNPDMYGLFTEKKGAQEYYDSIFELYASWDVDYIKCDDIANTEIFPHNPYSARREIEMIRKAIDKCGRDMVLSLSPGPAPVWEHEHLAAHANMWRMTGDFWDEWSKLYAMFERCYAWQEYVQPGAWPDCDMLPLGRIQKTEELPEYRNRYTRFTHDEQITMMTLWGIFRSPLMMGGEMRENDDFTLSLLQNRELIDMLKHSSGARQFKREETDGKGEIIWTSTGENCKYVALFNTDDQQREIGFDITAISIGGVDYRVWDMWKHEEHAVTASTFTAKVNPHGARLFKITVK